MSSTQVDAIVARFGVMASNWNAETSLATMRADLEAFFVAYDPPPGTQVEPITGAVAGEIVTAPGAGSKNAILYFHGGGYSTGSARAHRALGGYLSRAAGACVFNVDYRLAPEHPYPAAVEDAVAAYRFLLARGFGAQSLAVGGDSAGGGLALALLMRLRDEGAAMPACGVLLSPWADSACAGASYVDNAAIDPIANREMAVGMAATYLAGRAEPTTPMASPVYGDFTGLPPLLIHAGEREIFLDDARTIARKAQAARGVAELEIWPGMIHQWHLHVGRLDESAAALVKAGEFLRRRFGA